MFEIIKVIIKKSKKRKNDGISKKLNNFTHNYYNVISKKLYVSSRREMYSKRLYFFIVDSAMPRRMQFSL